MGRAKAYHDLRMAQAKAAEPQGRNLLAGDGENFAEGKPLRTELAVSPMPWLARQLRVTGSLKLLISLFTVCYLMGAIVAGPWWPPHVAAASPAPRAVHHNACSRLPEAAMLQTPRRCKDSKQNDVRAYQPGRTGAGDAGSSLMPPSGSISRIPGSIRTWSATT